MLSIGCSLEGRYGDAAWFIIFSVLTDKLDGFVARLVKGASEFGVQLDSFADFLNFGVAPATLWYAFLSRAPGLPYGAGTWHGVLIAVCILWVLAVTFRLARYNIVEDDPACRHIFFGLPTTLAGGTLMAFFLTALKYGSPGLQELARIGFDEPRLGEGEWGVTVWRAWPFLMLAGAYLMASAWKIPKLARARSKALTVFVFANVFMGYALGFARHFPEYLTFISMTWIVVTMVWAVRSPASKHLRPPAIFPRVDPPRPPQRPEEDSLLPDDDEDDESDPVLRPSPKA
jgi:CDP-diacylglycerol--serine O-phosphatidyltransferase